MPEQTTDRQRKDDTTTTTTTTTTTIAVARDGRVTLNAGANASTLQAADTDETTEAMQPLVMITTKTVTQSGGSGSGDPGTDPKGPRSGDIPPRKMG